MKESIIVFGASKHTKYTIDIIEQENKYNIIGIVDPILEKGSLFAGYKILGKDEELLEIIKLYNVKKGIVAVGDNFVRCKIVQKINTIIDCFSFVSAIHPSVIIGKNVKIGSGNVIMAGVIINNDTMIGNHCFLATKAAIDHDSYLNDYSSLSPGVTTGGGVKIGICTAICLGSNIIHNITIGNYSVIGAGSLIVKDIGDNVVVYGSPSKFIRFREMGERYL